MISILGFGQALFGQYGETVWQAHYDHFGSVTAVPLPPWSTTCACPASTLIPKPDCTIIGTDTTIQGWGGI